MMLIANQVRNTRGDWLVIAIPFLWLTLFFLLPTLIVLKLSFSQTAIAQPPYVPVFDLAAGWEGVKTLLAALTWDNYAMLAGDSLYIASYLKSLQVALIATVLLLLIGYPLAYAMARAPRRMQTIL